MKNETNYKRGPLFRSEANITREPRAENEAWHMRGPLKAYEPICLDRTKAGKRTGKN